MWVLIVNLDSPIVLPVNQFDHFYRGGDRIGALPARPRRPPTPGGMDRIGNSPVRSSPGPALRCCPMARRSQKRSAQTRQRGWEPITSIVSAPAPSCWSNFSTSGNAFPSTCTPNRQFARTHLGLAHGKTEAWYVLDAPPGAQVGVGFASQMSINQVRDWVMNRDSSSLLSALQNPRSAPG